MIVDLPDNVLFSVDTSCLITAWHRTHPPDIFPAVWNHIADLIDGGVLIASSLVKVELERQDDELLAWCAARDHFFIV